jgi:hypothetical protein
LLNGQNRLLLCSYFRDEAAFIFVKLVTKYFSKHFLNIGNTVVSGGFDDVEPTVTTGLRLSTVDFLLYQSDTAQRKQYDFSNAVII